MSRGITRGMVQNLALLLSIFAARRMGLRNA